MNRTPPPPERRRTIYRREEGTPLPFNQTNNGNPASHMYPNTTIPNTPSGPKRASSLRKRTRINMNNNNNLNHNNDYIRPQIIVSTTIQSLREYCEEHFKQIDFNHERFIDDLLRDKKYEIDNINKKYEEKINEKNRKHEQKKENILVECNKLEKIIKDQEREPSRKKLFQTRRA